MLILARRCGVTKMRMWNISCNMTPSFRWLLANGAECLVWRAWHGMRGAGGEALGAFILLTCVPLAVLAFCFAASGVTGQGGKIKHESAGSGSLIECFHAACR